MAAGSLRGRWAEDGPIPHSYSRLKECDSPEPELRTRLNVRDSDTTLILSHGELSGGSALTRDLALELGKPVKHLDPGCIRDQYGGAGNS